MRKRFGGALLLLSCAAVVPAQDEQLRHAFEGKTVVVKLDMPGDDGGINVYPQREFAVDYRKIGDSVKRYGAALRKGDSVTVTKVHIKPKLIEFQLGGGGYGSWGDSFGKPSVPSTYVGKSRLERDLEKERDSASGDRRRSIDRELDSLRRSRQREETRLTGAASIAKIEAQQWEERKRLQSGSRFNIHFEEGVPAEAATPEAIRKTLADYVDFGAMQPASRAAGTPALRTRPDANPMSLKKGMPEAEVTALLGEPKSRGKRDAAGLTVTDATYDLPESTVAAQFVNGVLTKFTITAK